MPMWKYARERPLAALALIVLTLLVALAASLIRASTAVPAAPCGTHCNPYAYSLAALHACGIQTYPIQQKIALPGGGFRYVYDVAGHRITDTVPPHGFNPVTATDAQLAEYNLPARPGPGAPTSALAAWKADMRDSHFPPALPFLVGYGHAHTSPVTAAGFLPAHPRSVTIAGYTGQPGKLVVIRTHREPVLLATPVAALNRTVVMGPNSRGSCPAAYYYGQDTLHFNYAGGIVRTRCRSPAALS